MCGYRGVPVHIMFKKTTKIFARLQPRNIQVGFGVQYSCHVYQAFLCEDQLVIVTNSGCNFMVALISRDQTSSQ